MRGVREREVEPVDGQEEEEEVKVKGTRTESVTNALHHTVTLI